MKVLAIDVGTGTQDIALFNTQLSVENSFKLVVPSPTMIAHKKIRNITQRGNSLLLTGVTMGGGPSHWATLDHIKAGYKVFATPAAARSFNDDLDKIAEMGIQLIGEEDVKSFGKKADKVELKDLDLDAVWHALNVFQVDLSDVACLGVAVFDHGNAPPDYSDRQFRFDYLDQQISTNAHLSSFAFFDEEIPDSMTRMQAVAQSARNLDMPMILMDTAPAAVLGASLDPKVSAIQPGLVANIGNFHTLAFRLNKLSIEGVFEHHTGLMNIAKMDQLLIGLAEGTITHSEVFNDEGHGAAVYDGSPISLDEREYGISVIGPRQQMMRGSRLRPYYAAPFGDMMLAGCFGLYFAMGEKMPQWKEEINSALLGSMEQRHTPWDLSE